MKFFSQKNILAIAIFGIIASIFISWLIYSYETQSIKHEFKLHVDEEIGFVEREIALNFNAVYALQAFFQSDELVEPDEFVTFSSEILLHHPNIDGLKWLPKLIDSQRNDFEHIRKQQYEKFEISELNDKGILVKALQRDIYYPVSFVAPVDKANLNFLGFDIGTDPKCLKALQLAEKTNKLTVTSIIPLVQEQKKQHIFLAVVPIYKNSPTTAQQRNDNLLGFVAGVFDINTLIESAIRHSSVKDIHIQLFDTTDGLNQAIFRTRYPQEQILSTISYSKDLLLIGGRQWSVVASPTNGYMTSRRTILPFALGFVGISITIALCYYLILIYRRSTEIEQAVRERTAELHEMKNELEKKSLQDSLTKISNRRHFDLFLKQSWAYAIRNKQPISMLMIDIDYFKQYNDHYGHQQGDACLQKVATTLKATVNRDIDLVARYGGEEFCVILPETEDASQIAEQCRQSIEQLQLPHEFSKVANHIITISIGFAHLHPIAADTPSQLISLADQALYAAKAAGRNQAQAYQYPHTTIV